jgi:hypothetical protein
VIVFRLFVSLQYTKFGHSDIISVDETPRYSLRDRQKSTPQPTQPSNQMAESSGAAQARSRSKTANPLAHLLREKRAADKRDRGIDGFNEAEQIIRQASSGSSLADNEHEEDDGDGDGYDNDDERVADVPIPTRPPFGATMSLSKLPQERFHTPERVHYLEPGLLQSRDRARLLEGANGAALRTVLEEDLANKRKVVQKRPCGVPFWEETHDVVPSQTFTPENILPPWEVAVEAPTSALSTLINAIEAAGELVLLPLDIIQLFTFIQIIAKCKSLFSLVFSMSCPCWSWEQRFLGLHPQVCLIPLIRQAQSNIISSDLSAYAQRHGCCDIARLGSCALASSSEGSAYC